MQDNRKSANRNTESTLSHRHHSLNLVHPSSCGLCTQERDEDGGGGDGGSGCICDFYRSVTPHPANSPEPRQRAFLLCPVSLLFDFWILEACQVPTYLSIGTLIIRSNARHHYRQQTGTSQCLGTYPLGVSAKLDLGSRNPGMIKGSFEATFTIAMVAILVHE
jgi:hypothetical protein